MTVLDPETGKGRNEFISSSLGAPKANCNTPKIDKKISRFHSLLASRKGPLILRKIRGGLVFHLEKGLG
jgi:hypothetical protein